MQKSLRLGRIFGIEIRLDYSWFIIFVLVTLSLTNRYADTHSDWKPLVSWGFGLATSLLFFASVLAHEMSHSLVAIRSGVPVRRITLFIFGGFAQITREPKRSRDEFIIALAGPGTSILIAILFGAIRLAIGRFSMHPVAEVAAWLSGINLVLAIFNLIPGFPLDGGRVLRSIIWGITKNFRKATWVASIIGRGVAYLFILLGIGMFFIRKDWIGGIWMVLIGWFLRNAAANSYRQLAMMDILQEHTASEVMTTYFPHVSRYLTLDELVQSYIIHPSRPCLPVVDEGQVFGLVTIHRVKKTPKERWAITTVGDVMTPLEQLKTLKPDDSLSDVLDKMSTGNVNQMPVIEDGRMIGMVARNNLLAFIHTRNEPGA